MNWVQWMPVCGAPRWAGGNCPPVRAGPLPWWAHSSHPGVMSVLARQAKEGWIEMGNSVVNDPRTFTPTGGRHTGQKTTPKIAAGRPKGRDQF